MQRPRAQERPSGTSHLPSKQASLDDYESSSLALAPELVQGTLEAPAAKLSEAWASEPLELASASPRSLPLLAGRSTRSC
mmetsp:Transcript_50774/g.157171  ORF Transcript_50774/g.157171 Transcript_50774/m.157171 type:complete len:80 (+) Transcript_50774:760-999(+)